MHLTIHTLGWCGAVFVLLAYVLVSLRRVEGDSLRFQSLNVVGGALLLGNTAYQGAYPSSFVNAVWIGIAVFALYQRGSRERVIQVSPRQSDSPSAPAGDQPPSRADA